MSALNVTLLAFAAERRAVATLLLDAQCLLHLPPLSIDMALSSKPAIHQGCSQMMGQTDRRTLDRFVHPALHTTRAVSINEQHTQHFKHLCAGFQSKAQKI